MSATTMPQSRVRHPLLAALCETLATLAATLATLYCARWLDPSPSIAVLAVVLCLSLSRSLLDHDWRGRLEAAWTLPLVGLAAVGVGMLLHRLPWLGALVFTLGIGASVWLRRFGTAARRASRLIALPLVALLTVPRVHADANAALPAWLTPMLVALIALLWISLAHSAARGLHLLPPVQAPEPASPPRESKLKPDATTRMALQMAVAVGAAFIVGFACFGPHWPWPVLTAFIVNSANRGRLDVIHKSLLRMLGAAAGTLLAGTVPAHLIANGRLAAALILAVLFLGTWLRKFGYAWWALCVTLALALVQDWLGAASEQALFARLLGILVGAAIGVAAAWFVLPVKSGDVLRRRIADALAALSAALDPVNAQRDAQAFVAAIRQLQLMAPALRSNRLLARLLRRRFDAVDWCEQLLASHDDAVALIERGDAPANVRRAVGIARKALLEPATLAEALHALHDTLAQANQETASAA